MIYRISASIFGTLLVSTLYYKTYVLPKWYDVVRSSRKVDTFNPSNTDMRVGRKFSYDVGRNVNIITSNSDVHIRTVARLKDAPVEFYHIGKDYVIADSFEEAAHAYGHKKW